MVLPALRTIPFLHEKRASPCWHRNGLARTDSVLAYDHYGWPTASLLDGQGENIIPPAAGYAGA